MQIIFEIRVREKKFVRFTKISKQTFKHAIQNSRLELERVMRGVSVRENGLGEEDRRAKIDELGAAAIARDVLLGLARKPHYIRRSFKPKHVVLDQIAYI